MQSVSSKSSWSLEYVPPSVDYLLSCKIENPQLDIEDGLCTPNDQKVFLTASMTFLQNHLIQKLQNTYRIQSRSELPKKAYSDLLLIGAGSKSKREKYFIRLKNTEQYHAVLKMEATVPVNRTLSIEQMLPTPKKSVKPTKSGIFGFWKSNSNTLVAQVPESEKSYKLFKIFRRSQSKQKLDKPDLKSVTDLFKLKQARCQLYVDLLPNPSSMISLADNATSSTSLAMNRLKMAPSFIKPYKFDNYSSTSIPSVRLQKTNGTEITQRFNSRSEGKKPNLNEELKILQCISEQEAQTLKRSFSEIHTNRVWDKSRVTCQTRDHYTSNSRVRLTKCNAKTNLKQQSKLSVCIEEDSESEDEEYKSCLRILNYSFANCTNFTDEVKSVFNSEYVPIVVKRL